MLNWNAGYVVAPILLNRPAKVLVVSNIAVSPHLVVTSVLSLAAAQAMAHYSKRILATSSTPELTFVSSPVFAPIGSITMDVMTEKSGAADLQVELPSESNCLIHFAGSRGTVTLSKSILVTFGLK